MQGGGEYAQSLVWDGTLSWSNGPTSGSSSWQIASGLVLGIAQAGYQGISLSSTGTVKCTLTYIGNGVPASKRWIRINATASSGGYSYDGSGSGSASNGRETVTYPPAAIASKPQYKQIAGSGGDTSVGLSATFSGGMASGHVGVGASFEVMPIYSLYNDDFEGGGNFRKGPSGRELNRSSPDGDKLIDTVAQWTGEYWDSASVSRLYSGYGGFANEAYTWAFLGSGDLWQPSQDNMNSGNSEVLFSVLNLSSNAYPNVLAVTSKVRAAVTDSEDDQAPSIVAKYDIRWHAPYENWVKSGRQVDFKDYYEATILQRNDIGLTTRVRTIERDAYLAAIDESSGYVVAALGLLPQPYGALAAVAGVYFTSFIPKEVTGEVVFSELWSAPNSLPSSRPAQPSGLWQIDRVWHTVKMHGQNYNGDSYGLKGYSGTTKQGVAQKYDGHWAAQFSLISGGGGTGPGPNGDGPGAFPRPSGG